MPDEIGAERLLRIWPFKAWWNAVYTALNDRVNSQEQLKKQVAPLWKNVAIIKLHIVAHPATEIPAFTGCVSELKKRQKVDWKFRLHETKTAAEYKLPKLNYEVHFEQSLL